VRSRRFKESLTRRLGFSFPRCTAHPVVRFDRHCRPVPARAHPQGLHSAALVGCLPCPRGVRAPLAG